MKIWNTNLKITKKLINKKFLLLSILPFTLVIIVVVGMVFAVQKINYFNSLQYNFSNAYNFANTSVDGKKLGDGYTSDVDTRKNPTFGNLINKFKNDSLNAKSEMSYKMAIEGLQQQMFRFLPPYVKKWDQIRDMFSKNKKNLDNFSAMKILLGDDYSGKNNGFVADSSKLTNNYLSDIGYGKPDFDKLSDSKFENYLYSLVKFFVGDVSNTSKPSYQKIMQKYFVNEIDNELGINLPNVNKNNEYGIIDPNKNTPINQNLLITLLFNRIIFSCGNAFFTGAISAAGNFFTAYDGYRIKRGVSNIIPLNLYSPLYIQTGIIHIGDLNIITNILDACNYIMYYEATKIYITHNFNNTSKDLVMFNEAKKVFNDFYTSYIDYKNLDDPVQTPIDGTPQALYLYVKKDLAIKLSGDLKPGGTLNKVYQDGKDIMNVKNILSPNVLYTNTHTLNQLLDEKKELYIDNGDPTQHYFYDSLNSFWRSDLLWV